MACAFGSQVTATAVGTCSKVTVGISDAANPLECAYSYNAGGNVLSAYAYAQGAPADGLHTYASASVSHALYQASATGFALATFRDQLTLANAPGFGFLHFTVEIDGDLSFESDSAAATPMLGLIVQAQTSTGLANYATDVLALTSAVTDYARQIAFDVEYQGGTPAITLTMFVSAGCGAPVGYSCSATADFRNSLRIIGLQIAGSDHAIVNGASFQSASGFDYAAAVPEPAPGVLTAVGVFALTKIRKLKARASLAHS